MLQLADKSKCLSVVGLIVFMTVVHTCFYIDAQLIISIFR